MSKKRMQYLLSIIIWGYWWLLLGIVGISSIILTLVLPKVTHEFFVKLICYIQTYSALIIPRHKGLKPKVLPFPVIFAANHVSFFDLFICGCSLPGNPRGIELKKYFNTPLYGWIISRFGMIPIDLTSNSSILKSLDEAAKKVLKKERSILIMPEGSRTRTGKPGPFKSGAFYLSRKYDIPIVPVVFKNLYKINNPNSILIKPGFCDIYLLHPVYPDIFKSDEDMAKYVEKLIRSKLEG